MSHEHTTTGWNKLDVLLTGFAAAGITHVTEPTDDDPIDVGDGWTTDLRYLRRCRFTAVDGKPMVAEEYLAVDDGECDGQSHINVAIYPDGERPELVRLVTEGGRYRYYGAPKCRRDGSLPDFRVNLTTGEVLPATTHGSAEDALDGQPVGVTI